MFTQVASNIKTFARKSVYASCVNGALVKLHYLIYVSIVHTEGLRRLSCPGAEIDCRVSVEFAKGI